MSRIRNSADPWESSSRFHCSPLYFTVCCTLNYGFWTFLPTFELWFHVWKVAGLCPQFYSYGSQFFALYSSVTDPYVFGPLGSGSGYFSQRYEPGSFCHQAKKKKTLVLFCDLFMTLSLKNDANVPSKSNKQKKIFGAWRSMTKIAGSWSISQRHGSADPQKCHGSATLWILENRLLCFTAARCTHRATIQAPLPSAGWFFLKATDVSASP